MNFFKMRKLILCWLRMEGIPGLLPADVLLKIFSYCSSEDLVQFQFVCRWWQQVSRHKYLWRDIVYKPGSVDTTKDIIEYLKSVPELRALHLMDVHCRDVTKELFAEIVKACPQLEQLLVCWYCFYKKFNLKMEKIKNLILYRNEEYSTQPLPSQDCIEHLHRCPSGVEHLKQFSLSAVRSGAFVVGDFKYLSVFKCFPNVVELELHHCTRDQEQELHTIAKNCPSVEKLTLSSRRFSDVKLKYVSSFKRLTFLCLKRNHDITDACVVHLQAVSELTYLDIAGCCKLTPQCLLALCSFPKLQTLKFDLQNCDPPAELDASHVKNPDLHLTLYNCKDTSVLDRLRSQRLTISLLKDFSSFCSYCAGERLQDYLSEED